MQEPLDLLSIDMQESMADIASRLSTIEERLFGALSRYVEIYAPIRERIEVVDVLRDWQRYFPGMASCEASETT